MNAGAGLRYTAFLAKNSYEHFLAETKQNKVKRKGCCWCADKGSVVAVMAPLALLLELTTLFLGIQAAALRSACGLGGAAWLRRRLEAFAQQRRQPLEGQLPVAPLGAMLSGHNPQHPATERGAQTLLQAMVLKKASKETQQPHLSLIHI